MENKLKYNFKTKAKHVLYNNRYFLICCFYVFKPALFPYIFMKVYTSNVYVVTKEHVITSPQIDFCICPQ